MSKVNEILKRKSERKARLQESLDHIVSQLKSLGALKIIVFGSFAQDDVDINSDLDLFVLMPSTRTGKEWLDIIYDTIERKVASDIIVYNEREFREMLPVSIFLQNVVKGKIVYEKAI
ncbi:nucleotidyltransferase domain-containing protein [Methanocella conradii]|uniref:nucleotidyltransferase domain-containing protein n=1 Tax=Methanocella conradii TaxID=1175444 RepID=UPI00157CC9A4|nr:nucleotidyltransferase domain-containing protein [Methanocella conradii]